MEVFRLYMRRAITVTASCSSTSTTLRIQRAKVAGVSPIAIVLTSHRLVAMEQGLTPQQSRSPIRLEEQSQVLSLIAALIR